MFLVVQKNLEVGEELAVDVSCIAALSGTVNVQIKYNGPMRRVVFGVISLSVFVTASAVLLFLLVNLVAFLFLEIIMAYNYSS